MAFLRADQRSEGGSPMSVANNIKQARMALHIHQDELAEAIHCNVKTISRYETGERCPTLELALRMAAYLNISTDELFRVEYDPHEQR